MINKCKFDVEVSYNSDYFTESELRETIRNSISDLSDSKEQKFGKKVIAKPGIHNSGASCNITQQTESELSDSIDLVETLVSLSSCMDSDTDPTIVLPEAKMEELMTEVRTTFKD
tara:strand:- start:270 stop:614 length:345 start_codon:yes stop_codon:yes gene_type:complete